MQGRMKDAETPEGLVLTDEIRTTVNAAIDALPEDLRNCLLFCQELEGAVLRRDRRNHGLPGWHRARSRIFRARGSD